MEIGVVGRQEGDTGDHLGRWSKREGMVAWTREVAEGFQRSYSVGNNVGGRVNRKGSWIRYKGQCSILASYLTL